MTVWLYNDSMANEWNDFVRASKNGTFLFCRDFMDYHADRYKDASLVFVDKKNNICGLFPANIKGDTVYSHGGLTYGGFVLNDRAVQTTVNEMFVLAADYYAKNYGAIKIIYKPVPHIYHKLPSEEDLYALFRADAKLIQRGVSSALCPQNHPKQRQSRRGGVVRAQKNNISVEEIKDADSEGLKEFHNLLENILKERHNVAPVHSYYEMQLLMNRFPNEIVLYVAKYKSEILAGSWVFITPAVVHTQYLAASDLGKKLGAEDLLIDWLISERFQAAKYFDFGISTENGGSILNKGLIFEKEGFGARSVCYDAYMIKVDDVLEKTKGLV